MDSVTVSVIPNKAGGMQYTALCTKVWGNFILDM